MVLLRGVFQLYFLYDVAEEFNVDQIRNILGERASQARQVFPRRTPEYIRFEEPPIIDQAVPTLLFNGQPVACSIKYYRFAVCVVQLDVPFDCGWSDLLRQASHWMDTPELEPLTRELLRERLKEISSAALRPNTDWLQESYFITAVDQVSEPGGPNITATDLLGLYGGEIAQLVRGEAVPLAQRTTEEALQSSLSYYPSDLVVIGAAAALVFDRSDDASATFQVLEYAKVQLLEFRYYDGLMTRLLSEVYDALEAKRTMLAQRWNLPRQSERFNTIRLDLMELTERVDNAVKFVSDAYYARVYRLASNRIGLPEYRALVDEKLRTMEELYDFMVDRFNEARSFIVELSIAILAFVDVILLFVLLVRGK